MIFWLITACLLIPYLGLLLFFRREWLKPAVPPAGAFVPLPFISVIIPARNEERNISRCIDSVMQQSYPAHLWELIVADDHSEDSTAAIIRDYVRLHGNIRLLQLSDLQLSPDVNSFKKLGIETAISMAKGTLIVTTDADCEAPPTWLETIANYYSRTKSTFMALPVRMAVKKGSSGSGFLQIFQALDFMTLQGITGAVVKSGFASMCNGANLAYEKAAFEKVDGFKGVDRVASGDDMLLMEKITRISDGRIDYVGTPAAIVETEPEFTIRAFFRQRIRWASKSTAYKSAKLKTVLLLVFLLNLWLVILTAFGAVLPEGWLLVLAWGAKILAEMFFLLPVAAFFGQRNLMMWFIPAQPFHVIYTVIAGILGNFKTYEWKGRIVR